MKEKKACSFTDLWPLLNLHWCLDQDRLSPGRYDVQADHLTKMMPFTSSRPGTMVASHDYSGLQEVVKHKVSYVSSNNGHELIIAKDLQLSLLRNKELGGDNLILVLELTTMFLIGNRNKRES